MTSRLDPSGQHWTVLSMPTGERVLRRLSPRPRQKGTVLLISILFIAATALASSAVLVSHATQARRDKEEQLLFVGDQFRKAIASYQNTVPPNGVRSLPPNLEALILDRRFAVPVRHLRRVYLDPVTGKADWTLVTSGGGVVGVRSSSQHSPLKQAGFPSAYRHFERAQSYSEWVFSIAR